MLRFEAVATEQAVAAVCDRCGREMQKDAFDGEWQEKISIDFRSAYGSVFGDGNDIALDLCQHCFKDTLGPWVRVTEQVSAHIIDEAIAFVDASNQRIEAMEQKAADERRPGRK
ncbi:MAG: hypothetical protein M1547_02990 [Gammaproteobacteria bacterium]|nr:hypothetical protein [Gammaproteobacteria bacterium]